MGQKFIGDLMPSSKLGRTIRGVSAFQTPKSRKTEPKDPITEKELGPGGLARTRRSRIQRGDQIANPPIPPQRAASHKPGHVLKAPKKPRTAKQKAATARNFKKMMQAASRRR